MAMIFIWGCKSTSFHLDLRRQGEGITWQFITQQGTGWDRASRCEEQNGDNKALAGPTLVAQGVSGHLTGHILEALLPQGELKE